MEIEVNISKRHFIIILGVILVLGVIGLAYAFGGSNPSVMGHSIAEIDWSAPIPGDLRIQNGLMINNNQYVLRDDGSNIDFGDLQAADGTRGLTLKAGYQPRLTITSSGDVNVPGQFSSPRIVKSAFYYVGWDNNGETNPDCWLIGKQGVGTEWGVSNPSSQAECVSTSLSQPALGLPNVYVARWYDTGLSGDDPGNGHNDATSDRIYVEVTYTENLQQAF